MKMKYSIDEATTREYLPSVEQATQLLERAIGESAARTEARWEFATDSASRPGFNLEVWDHGFGGKHTRFFALNELQPTVNLRLHFHLLWGDVLQDSSNIQHEKVEASLQKYFAEVDNGQDEH